MAMAIKPWEQYQEDVAALLSELGFTTQVNDLLTGLSGATHAVDVSARRSIAGVQVLWIVECKLWRDRVPKEKVAALSDILTDLHADRGLMMSESGFQSGAIQLAHARAITLSNLGDLRAQASDELVAARINRAERRLLILERHIMVNLRRESYSDFLPALWATLPFTFRETYASLPEPLDLATFDMKTFTWKAADAVRNSRELADWIRELQLWIENGSTKDKWRDGIDQDQADSLVGDLHAVRRQLNQGKADYWPIIWQFEKIAFSFSQLLPLVEAALGELERRAALLVAAADRD